MAPHAGGEPAPARTAAQVAAARAEYFDTRTSGRAETLGGGAAHVRAGGARGAGRRAGSAGRGGGHVSVGDAVGPQGGRLRREGGEVRGAGVVRGMPMGGGGGDGVGGGEGGGGGQGQGAGGEWDAPMRGREIKVRARLSHNARDIVVRMGEEDSVALLISRVKNAAKVRFGCLDSMAGRLTDADSDDDKGDGGVPGEDDEREGESGCQGWREGHVVNVFVFE